MVSLRVANDTTSIMPPKCRLIQKPDKSLRWLGRLIILTTRSMARSTSLNDSASQDQVLSRLFIPQHSQRAIHQTPSFGTSTPFSQQQPAPIIHKTTMAVNMV